MRVRTRRMGRAGVVGRASSMRWSAVSQGGAQYGVLPPSVADQILTCCTVNPPSLHEDTIEDDETETRRTIRPRDPTDNEVPDQT